MFGPIFLTADQLEEYNRIQQESHDKTEYHYHESTSGDLTYRTYCNLPEGAHGILPQGSYTGEQRGKMLEYIQLLEEDAIHTKN